MRHIFHVAAIPKYRWTFVYSITLNTLDHPIHFTFFMLFSSSFGKLNVKWLFIQIQWQKQILANLYWADRGILILCLHMDFVRLESLIHMLEMNYRDYYSRNNIHWKSSCANEHNKHRVLYFMGYIIEVDFQAAFSTYTQNIV